MAIPTDALAGNAILIGGPVLLRGFALCNKNGASQDFELYDGVDVNGTPIAFLHLASGGNANQGLDATGLLCDIGIFITIPGGPLKGAVWVTELTGPRADQCAAFDQADRQDSSDGTRGLRIPGHSPSEHAPGNAPGY